MGGGRGRTLPPGLYDETVTRAVATALVSNDIAGNEVDELDAHRVPLALTRVIAPRVLRALEALGGEESKTKQVALANRIIELLRASPEEEAGRVELHISFGQHARMAAAVGERFAFFLVTMLGANELSLSPFIMPSGIHHLVFEGKAVHLAIAEFDAVFARYRTSFRPIPFVRKRSN